MSVAEEIRQRYVDFSKDQAIRPTRLILGEAKRIELFQELKGHGDEHHYRYSWHNPDKRERFMGLEILVDMGDQDRLEIE